MTISNNRIRTNASKQQIVLFLAGRKEGKVIYVYYRTGGLRYAGTPSQLVTALAK